MSYIDLTRTYTADMPVYPGDPKSELIQTAFLQENGYNDFTLRSGLHVWTHIDAPLHMIENGKRIYEYAIDKFIGNWRLIDARDCQSLDESLLIKSNVQYGDILLIMTGAWKLFGKPEYYSEHFQISEWFARKLVELNVRMIGLDAPSPDQAPFPIHKILLSGDVLIIENLCSLEDLLPYSNFEIIALPAKFDSEAAPIRVIARISN